MKILAKMQVKPIWGKDKGSRFKQIEFEMFITHPSEEDKWAVALEARDLAEGLGWQCEIESCQCINGMWRHGARRYQQGESIDRGQKRSLSHFNIKRSGNSNTQRKPRKKGLWSRRKTKSVLPWKPNKEHYAKWKKHSWWRTNTIWSHL